MTQYENAIELKDVVKKYTGFTLDGVSFCVPKGSIMGFIGQNGAGKTTTIRAMMNIISTDGGEIKLLGMDHVKDEREIKARTAVVFDDIPFHETFTATDMGRIFAGIYPEWNKGEYEAYLDRFELPAKKKTGKFSSGMKMKLQIACALSHNAELLVMDEATTGLDPVVRDEILHIFMEYIQGGERSILMSSHITSDLEKIADCITLIDRGRILLSGVKDDMLDNHGIMKCERDYSASVDAGDIVSVRLNRFGAEVMIKNRSEAKKKYPDAIIDPASIDDIMLYYVHKQEKEWS